MSTNANRGCAVFMLLCVATFFLYAAVSRFNGNVQYSNEQTAGQGKGNWMELGGVAIGGVFVIAMVVGLIANFIGAGASAHRRKSHAYAQIVWDEDCAYQIEVSNLDDVDVAVLHQNVHWSRLQDRTRMGNGRWVWTFGYMGDGRNENNLADPVHIMYMRDAEKAINRCLEQVINPAKDME